MFLYFPLKYEYSRKKSFMNDFEVKLIEKNSTPAIQNKLNKICKRERHLSSFQ